MSIRSDDNGPALPNYTTDPSSKQNVFGKDTREQLASIGTAAAHATFPSWMSVILMISLIFGGCCANVFALEAIIKEQPSSGPRSLFLNPRAIPIRSWLMYTAYFVTINLLNNWAFAYKISVPLHIIVRSGGPVASMIVGYIFNARRYSWGQIMAVVLLTLGVVGAALADADSRGHMMSIESDSSAMVTTVTGFSILALAMILSAFQGIFADRLYEKYGRNHWKEALFYSHTLSLPLFLPTYPQLRGQWQTMLSSPPLISKLPDIVSSGSSTTSVSNLFSSLATAVHQYGPVQSVFAGAPTQVAYLLINALTQFLCIRGVHLLSAKTSSLTVTIVLNIRKLVSLLLSIYLFGNHLAPGVLFGAALVFAGGGLYGFEGARLREKSVLKKE